MNFDQRELNIIGHWSSSSKMPERYDRAVCSKELLLRNTIIQKVVSGWEMAPSFHLPMSVPSDHRIGRETQDETPIEPILPSVTIDSSTPSGEVSLTPALLESGNTGTSAVDEST